MTFRFRSIGLFLLIGALVSALPAQAALTFWVSGDLMIIHGGAESGDAGKLKEKLTPTIKTVVLRSPTGMDFRLARELGEVIDSAGITTVVHGSCSGIVCPVLFLSGRTRMFSGASRPETHGVSLYIGDANHVISESKDSIRMVMDWWASHTKLTSSDLSVHRASFFSIGPGSGYMDRKIFFPVQAKLTNGNAIHCPGSATQQFFIDCLPYTEGNALTKGIVTTEQTFVDSRLVEAEDMQAPAPTNFASLSDASVVPAGDSCKKMYADFLRQPAPRAFYVNSLQGCGWNNQQSFRPLKASLDNCKKKTPSAECRLYAVDDKVVFTPFDQPLPAPSAAAASDTKPSAALTAQSTSLLLARSASKEDGPSGVSDTFSVEGKILAYLTIKTDEAARKASPVALEVRWFNDGKLVSSQRQQIELAASPTRVWVPVLAADIGVGKASVEVYAGNEMIARKSFSVAERL